MRLLTSSARRSFPARASGVRSAARSGERGAKDFAYRDAVGAGRGHARVQLRFHLWGTERPARHLDRDLAVRGLDLDHMPWALDTRDVVTPDPQAGGFAQHRMGDRIGAFDGGDGTEGDRR